MRVSAYAMVGGNLAAAAVLLRIFHMQIDRSVALALLSPVPAICGGLLLAKRGRRRLGGFLECFGLFASLSITTMLVLIPLAASAAPYVDPSLAAADEALGFDYRAAIDLMLPAAPLLRAVYATFQLQACLVPAILFATGHGERAWRFLLIVGVTLAATDVLFPIFPAQGAAVHFGLPQSYRAAVGDLSWHFPAVLNAIRAGAQTIDRTMLTGLVSFPSFHAAAALIYGWAVWPVRELRWPAILLNVGVCVSAVFVGAHYLVDVVAGLALASSVIALCQRERKAVFSRRSETIEVQGERARVKAG